MYENEIVVSFSVIELIVRTFIYINEGNFVRKFHTFSIKYPQKNLILYTSSTLNKTMGLISWVKSIFTKEQPRGGEIMKRDFAERAAIAKRNAEEREQRTTQQGKVLERDLRQLIAQAYEQGYDFVLLLEDLIPKIEKSGTQYNVDVWKEKLQSQVFKRLNIYFTLLAKLKLIEKKEAPLKIINPLADLQRYELNKGSLMAERPAQFAEKVLPFLRSVLMAVKIRQQKLIEGLADIEKIKQEREAA